MRLLPRLLAAGLGLAALPAFAATTQFSGTLDIHAGYGSNPYLNANNLGGSGLVGATLSAGLVSRAATSTTALTGIADYSHNFSHYGDNQNYTIDLSRSQQLSERVSIFGDVGYSNTLNPGVSYQNSFSSGALYNNAATGAVSTVATGTSATAAGTPTGTASDPSLVAATNTATVPVGVFDPASLDLFTIGQRTQTIRGSAGLTWTPTARDQFSVNGSASRLTYKRLPYDYVQYGGSVTWLHTVSARTRVGLDGGISVVNSSNYQNSRSYTADVVLVEQLSAIWNFNGRIGVIVPQGLYDRGTSVTLGFSGTLCGTYPRSSICFSASRQAAPTGIGGLRTDLQFTASLSYALNEHTRVNAAATYDHSKGVSQIYPGQDYYQASLGASRDVSRRVAVGFSGRVQRRTSPGAFGFGNATGWAVTADLITRFGHVAR